MENGSLIGKTYAYDANGNQISETDQEAGKQTVYEYDADNRLRKATGRTGETVDYVQENQYNGFGQRVQKKEGSDVTAYFYDGSTVLYTEDAQDKVTSFNLIGAENNILQTARAGQDDAVNFYTYTKDLRESTINIVGADGTSQVTYDYDDYGETKTYDKDSASPFYNEVCYTAGIYDKTTGLYNLNARYYDPENGVFMTQDTYRGSRSRTATLNLYAYCTGNPVKYTDPSGHWAAVIAAIAWGALGAYDGYKYAKKKKLKGKKKAIAIAGSAALGAVNPIKIKKVVSVGYKATKLVKAAVSAQKSKKSIVKAIAKAKTTVVEAKEAEVRSSTKAYEKAYQLAKSREKIGKNVCFTAGTKIHTEKGFKNIEKIRAGDFVWSENPETKEKALKQVKKIFVREKDSIVRLAINGEVIETTSEHPFYVEGKGWIAAGELTAGTEVRLEDGSAGIVTEKEDIQLEEPVTVYNFEVEDYHTYYVSEQKALVHNTCAVTAKNVASKSDVITYSPVNPGPLEDELAASFEGATYIKRVLIEDTIMYRVYGGGSKKVGRFFSLDKQYGGLQSQLDLALLPKWGNSASNVTRVVVPKGTVIYEGRAAPQVIRDSMGNKIGQLPGGGSQVIIENVDARWFN